MIAFESHLSTPSQSENRMPRTLWAPLLIAGLLSFIASHAPADEAQSQVATAAPRGPMVLRAADFKHYIDTFNKQDDERIVNYVPNSAAWEFLRGNIPLFECPDKEIEQTYYFRWWTYRKHIKWTTDGFVVTEFLPSVPWGQKHNTICCPVGHHYYEGRWLHDRKIMDEYSIFWFRKGGNARWIGCWLPSGIYARTLVTGDEDLAVDLLDDLVAHFRYWERERRDPSGVFWQRDGGDGMEVSIGGIGYRATINSYMYGDALAIAHIAELAGKPELAKEFRADAVRIKRLVQDELWDSEAQFFKVRSRPGHKTAGILEWKVNGDVAVARNAKAAASHCPKEDRVEALNDGQEPKSSADKSIPRLTFWPHQGSSEWVEYELPAEVDVSSVAVYWYHDGNRSAVPAEWKVLYRDGDRWTPVAGASGYGCETDQYNEVRFQPVTTRRLRIELSTKLRRDKIDQKSSPLVDVRELHGYTPWYFNMPDPQYSVAWKQVMDPQGFYARFGPTTAERRHPRFMFAHGHDCTWNGPSWPYATSVTLTAMANLLNNYDQDAVDKADYLDLVRIYARSHRLRRSDGTVVSWIDEDLHPDTGEWIARNIHQRTNKDDERGKDYNHSSFCDLVISGLVGLRPRADETVEVNPLVPPNAWDYFCLDHIPYHGRSLTILWDKTGKKYGHGPGLKVFADGRPLAESETLTRVTGKL